MIQKIGLLLLCFFALGEQGIAQKKDTIQNAGKASFYDDSFQGQETSNGEFYDKDDFTAAHRTLPFNSIVNVYNKNTGRSAIVRINDRGPFVRSRIIDVSRSAAMKLGLVHFGVAPVSIHIMTLFDHLPLNDSSFHAGEVWDCFGRQTQLENQTVYVWQSASWKHTFYMAGHIALDYHLPGAQILVSGEKRNRRYKLVVTGMTEKKDCAVLISKLRKDGYISARMLNDKPVSATPSAAPQPAGQSPE